MRILALLTDGIGARGGIARYNSDLLQALSQSSHVTSVLALPRHGVRRPDTPGRVVQLPPEMNAACWAAKAGWLNSTQRFDVIFCGHMNAAPFAARLARMSRRRLWLQAHGIEAWSRPGPSVEKSLHAARLVTAVSRTTRERLLGWSNVDPARVRVLPNAAPATFRPGTAPAVLIERHGLAGRSIILTVGRLDPRERYKGHDRIIRALPRIRQCRPDACYLVVGGGADQERLAAIARERSVEAHVTFAGEIAEADLPAYFQLSNVFAMPSTGEGFGIVFLEAAAAGLPVVAGSRDGSRDALADGAFGTLIDPDDEEALVGALIAGIDATLPLAGAAAERFSAHNFRRHVNRLVHRHFIDEATG